ncbi:MAG TPA: ATP-binding protein [Cytophagaceae bacterium]|jgi:signal transduction histidine kinase
MTEVDISFLLSIDSLRIVPHEQLQWLIDKSNHYTLEESAYLFKENEKVRGTHIIISGQIKIFSLHSSGIREISLVEPKDITGYLPYSRGLVAMAFGQALVKSQVMTFPIELMNDLIHNHFELTQALVHIMTNRVRDFTALQQQNEKMMALGKLSAGLAHELNNPASAIVRGSASLKKHLQLLPDSFKHVLSIKMNEDQIDAVNNKMCKVISREKPASVDPMIAMDQETALSEWLDNRGLQKGDETVNNLAEYGFTTSDLNELYEMIPNESLVLILKWINDNLETEKMVSELQEASQRISHLVNSIKSFTHMDRGNSKEYADIHVGISNTITMLQHKIKKGNIQLIEEYDRTIPFVNAYVGELNQVWTNLIDNALDAMEQSAEGILKIKTEKEREYLKVTISDNGPGIPEEIKSKIFDPFFTTKEIGKGTGLGLDIVSRIINQHRGSIKLKSRNGLTEFAIYLPIEG